MQHLSIRVDQLAARTTADPASITVIGGYTAAIIHALEARGVTTATILAAAGMPHVPSNDPLVRVPLTSVRQLLAAAVELTGDPYFGLYAANFLHTANLHALGYAMLASGTLRELCERLTRNFRLLTGTSRPALIEAGDAARLEFFLVAESPPLSDDAFGLFLARLISTLSDGKVRPTRMELHRPTPPDGGVRHRREFGCPVSFGAPHTAFVFDSKGLDVPLTGACRELAEQNERIVVGYLAKLDRNDIRMRVRALLLQELDSGEVTKESIAKKLCMSPRTLQIKLAKSDTTFQDVVNETRRALACGYIENSGMSITEIAYTLGFSDTSNFSRAFRRWTGRSPRAYAAQLREPNASQPLQVG
jgi:AraC-like DNA-binding protein